MATACQRGCRQRLPDLGLSCPSGSAIAVTACTASTSFRSRYVRAAAVASHRHHHAYLQWMQRVDCCLCYICPSAARYPSRVHSENTSSRPYWAGMICCLASNGATWHACIAGWHLQPQPLVSSTYESIVQQIPLLSCFASPPPLADSTALCQRPCCSSTLHRTDRTCEILRGCGCSRRHRTPASQQLTAE
jgi:hypothetical protein